MIKRKKYVKIERWICNKNGSALLVTGARQVGKTSLIREVVRHTDYELVEFNLIDNPEIIASINESKNSDDLITKLSFMTNKRLKENKTIIFLDEVQECKEILTKIKFMVEDKRYRYVLSGSLLGVELNDIKSAPVGYLEEIEMHPLGIEEFFEALGIEEKILLEIENAFRKQKPIDNFIHKKLLETFYLYLIVGGMPAVVQKYIDTRNLDEVLKLQKNIIKQYKRDFTKYEKRHKLNLQEIYDSIPSELGEKNKRFFINHIDGKASFDRVKNNFIWLKNAGVSIPIYNITELTLPLEVNMKRNLFKLFSSDIGLLTSYYSNTTKLKILNQDKDINKGGIFENAIAQELLYQEQKLFYYNNKAKGELDFVIEYEDRVIPIEVKSGKSYERHCALNNVLSVKNLDIDMGIVFCNDNVSKKGKVLYLPIYMVFCLKKKQLDNPIYEIDLSGL